MQLSLGLPDPREASSSPILKRVQTGIKRAKLLRHEPARLRLPITVSILGKIRSALDTSNHPQKVLIWACAAFFGFFRLGELLPENIASIDPATSLMWGDVAIDNHKDPGMGHHHGPHSPGCVSSRCPCHFYGAAWAPAGPLLH